MFAKQTRMSASLVIWLFGATPALADDSPPQAPDTGEVQPPGATVPTPAPDPDHHHPTGRFQIGAGYADGEGFIAEAQIAQDDLFHTGMQLSMTARISALRQLFDLHFADPTLFGTKWMLSTDLYSDARVLPGLTRQATGIVTDLSHPLGNHVRAFVGYRLEDVKATDTLTTSARAIDGTLPPLGGGLISALRGGVIWSNVDALESRGGTMGATVELSDHALGSAYDLTRVHAFAKSNIPVGPLVLHLSGGLDSVLGDAPRSERIYLGINDVRGYGPGAFGPINGLGQPVGGDLMIKGRAELEVPLSRRYGISLVGFYDAAAITSGASGQAGRSVGFGILWRSPIGTLQFDWAFPQDGGKPHFVFGL